MTDNNVSSVVIEPNAKGEWGVLTRRDIVTKIVRVGKSPGAVKVKEIASRPLHSVPADTSIVEAAKVLADRGFSRITIAEGGRIIGIVTETDIFNAVEKFGSAISE